MITRNHTGHRVGESHQRAKDGDDTVRRARALREEGRSYRAIGEALGVSMWTVRDWCAGWTRWAA